MEDGYRSTRPLLMRDQENIEKGIERGKEQGEEMMSELIKKLMEDNRNSDIIKVTQDKEYRQKLYDEYNISK